MLEPRSRIGISAALVVLALLGCTGRAEEAPLRPGGEETEPPVANPRRPGETLPAFQPGPTGLRLLGALQYENSLSDVLGEELRLSDLLDPDPIFEDEFAFSDELLGERVVSPIAVEKYDLAARTAAAQIFDDPARRQALVGCAPVDAVDPCVEAFLARLLLRAWRRPADAEELARYGALIIAGEEELGSVWEGLEMAVAAALSSPHFLYRVELGEGGRFDDYEMATRLSYFVWDTTPDDALLAAAERGELTTDEGLRRELSRLLESPRARAPMARFFAEWLGYANMDDLSKDPAVFPAWTPELGRAMRREMEALVERIVWEEDGSLLELFDTDRTFVDATLASFYGVAVPEGAVEQATEIAAWLPGPVSGCEETPGYANICSEQELGHAFEVPTEGPVRFTIRAYGVEAGGALPQMVFTLDGAPVLERAVGGSAESPEELVVERPLSAGAHTLGVAFTNDYYELPENRDLRLASVRIEAIERSGEMVEVALPPERRGYLTTGAFLATFARPTDTSPTHRGLFVRERLLCEHIPPPPPGVAAALPPPPPGEHITNRERVELHLTDDVCATCHQHMDPLGLPLEHFDGLGAYRATDQGLPLDVTGNLDGAPFDGAVEMAATLTDDQRLIDCAVRQLYRHATGRRDSSYQHIELFGLADTLAASGHSMRSLIEAFVLSPAFRTAGDPR